jgi:hypothetical protein
VVQRQAVSAPPPSTAPAPASGVTSPGPSAPAPGASTNEADPIELPVLGDASITLTPGMSVPLDFPDLREFAIGKGTLATEPIELGEVITAAVEIGSHNPGHLLEPSLKLTPVIVTITAAQIATAKSTKETVTKGLGIEGAAIGGIVGGLLAGFAGVDPITGARPGDAIGRRLGEAAAVVVVGEQLLRATLTSGALVGHFPLVYTPFLWVRLNVSFISKLVDVHAMLQTQMPLDVVPFLSFVGSAIDLASAVVECHAASSH